MLGFPMGMRMALELHPDFWRGLEKISNDLINFDMPSNVSCMKYALKSIPGLADVGVPHGDGDGPRTPPRCPEGLEKISDD